jgi:hypothetical protein
MEMEVRSTNQNNTNRKSDSAALPRSDLVAIPE